jgi:hypothetical protein
MPDNEVSTWIWRRYSVLVLIAVVLLSACMPSNPPAATEDAEFAVLPPQTPKTSMDDSSNNCRIRDEVPEGDMTILSLPEIDVQALQGQDQNLPKDAPLRFATATKVNINAGTYGRWESTKDSLQVWRLKIISPQALSLSLGFTSFSMPAGGCLFVYSPDQKQVLGPYTMADNAEHGQLWTPTVDGEEVIIEISVPKDQVSRMQLVLGVINQGYRK